MVGLYRRDNRLINGHETGFSLLDKGQDVEIAEIAARSGASPQTFSNLNTFNKKGELIG